MRWDEMRWEERVKKMLWWMMRKKKGDEGVFMERVERVDVEGLWGLRQIKGQTTGVLGFVYLCKDMVGANPIGYTILCWSSSQQHGPSFTLVHLQFSPYLSVCFQPSYSPQLISLKSSHPFSSFFFDSILGQYYSVLIFLTLPQFTIMKLVTFKLHIHTQNVHLPVKEKTEKGDPLIVVNQVS